jgi:hypothetical protein
VLLALCAPALAAPGFVADQTLSSNGADVPVIAFASNGYGIVAWNQYNGGPSVIDVSVRPPGGAWSAPQALDESSISKAELSVAIDAAGEAAVAWEDSVDQGGAQAMVATRPAGAAFGAPEMLADGSAGKALHPAVGIDAGGRVTLLYDRSPDVAERTFAVGSSALAVAPRVVSADCDTDQTQLAVAPSGDAVAAFRCGGAIFALRRAGSWTVSPIVADSGTSCPAPTISEQPSGVAIDSQGQAVGVLSTQTQTWDPSCTQRGPSSTSIDLRLVLPVGGAMTPVSGPPAASEASSVVPEWPLGVGGIAIGPSGILLGYGVSPSSFAVQGEVRSFDLAGAPLGPAQTLQGSWPGAGVPRVALAANGSALAVWEGPTTGGDALLASMRPPGGTFGAPVAITSSADNALGEHLALDDAGDGAVSWHNTGEASAPHPVHVRGFDATPPQLGTVSIPTGAHAGRATAFAASASDFWGPVSLTWSFGDGGSASGAAPTHAFHRGGTFTATVTATDAVGNAASRSGVVHVVARAPSLSRLSLVDRRFRVGPVAAAIAARVRRRRMPVSVGTAFRFTLDEAAAVTIAFARPVVGRVSRGRCVASSRRLHSRPRCTRFVGVGRLMRRLSAGRARVPFSGRIGRRALAPRRYRATLTPTAFGLTGASRRVSFDVVR